MFGFVAVNGRPWRMACRDPVVLCLCTRRELILIGLGSAAGGAISLGNLAWGRRAEGQQELQGPVRAKPATVYPDFKLTESGLQIKDVRIGDGNIPREGDRAVIDWEGYTLGHNGYPFAAKNRVKGGDFQGDQDFYRWVVGDNSVIPGLDEAVRSMCQGGIRQIVVPPELGYPAWDPKHVKVGPAPKTFSGQQRLNYVLTSKGYVDSTLLINIELIRVDRPGERGFRR